MQEDTDWVQKGMKMLIMSTYLFQKITSLGHSWGPSIPWSFSGQTYMNSTPVTHDYFTLCVPTKRYPGEKNSFIVALWIWNPIRCSVSEIYTWLYHDEWNWGKWQHYLKLPYLVMGDKKWCTAMGKIPGDLSYKTQSITQTRIKT